RDSKKPQDGEGANSAPGEEGQALPPDLAEGQPQQVLEAESVAKKTRPPKRLTDATLLTAMETAGKALDDRELSEAMKESGLGTPATRAQIIEVLLKRRFIARRGKSLEATDKGIRLIEVVHPEVKSPAMTGQWEAYLKRIERGQAQLVPFLQSIEQYVREVVGKVGSAPAAEQPSDRIDGRPSGKAEGVRIRGRPHPFEPRPGRLARSLRAVSGRKTGLPLHRPGAAARERIPGDARQTEALLGGHRRGALHFPVGTRLPPGLPDHRPAPAGAPARACHRAHCNGDAAGPERHRTATGSEYAEASDPRLS